VVKEARATYSVIPGLEADRPGPATKYPNVLLAGDWTATGWPATMEGAVRSGYLVARSVARSARLPQRFLIV
jgi:zeta-carotene desaturase